MKPVVFLMLFASMSFGGIFGNGADKALIEDLSTDVDSLSSQLSDKEWELELAEAAKREAALAKDRLLREIGGYKTTIESLQVSLAASGRECRELSAYAKLHEKRQKVSVVERLGLSPVHNGPPESYLTDPRVKARIKKTIKAMPLIPELEQAFIAQVDTAAPTTGRLDNGLYEFMGFSKFRYLGYTYVALDSTADDYAWTFPPVDAWGRKAQLTIPWACFNPTIRWLLADTVIQRDTVKVDSIIEIRVESPPDTVVRDSIIIDTICPPPEPPQDKKQSRCKWGELFMWLGHYSPVPHLDEGRGEFLGSMGEVFFGCSRTNFGLGYYANGWDWKTYSGRSSGFEAAAGPALNFAWRRARLMLFAYYDIEGSWFESDHQEDVYTSRQWSHSVYPGLTFSVWSADGDRWFESWLNSQIMVEGYKLSHVDGQVQSRENDPANDKTCIFFGSRLFPFSGFGVDKKMHLGFSAKVSHTLEDERVELILGPVIDINHVLKLSFDWKGTFNSQWEKENGNSVGVVLDLDVVNAVNRNR